MKDKINAEEWTTESIFNICRFLRYWGIQSEKFPNEYPKSMNRGDWDEQFDSFQYEKE